MAESPDRVAALERQVQELKQLLESERDRHKEDIRAAASKRRLLQSQLAAQSSEEGHSHHHRTTTTTRTTVAQQSSTSGTRDLVVGTPRTSDHLFVAVRPATPRGTSPSKTVTTTTTTRVASTSPAKATPASSSVQRKTSVARTHVGAGAPTKTSTSTVSVTSKVSSTRVVKSETSSALTAAAGSHTTALQHAWDKFCFQAREQFTPVELALISAETLESLLNHYKFQDSVERAQIEAQWALLQEGKQTVGANATPREVRPNVRSPIKRATHSSAFAVEPEFKKPHLSRRQLLVAEPVRVGNPNLTTSGSRFVRTGSAVVPLTPRGIAPSNPNDTHTLSLTPRSCARRSYSAGPKPETPRGMMHVQGPDTKELTLRGIRSEEGSTFQNPRESKLAGIRCHNELGQSEDHRRGLRTTYDKDPSPTRTHRPVKIVTSPPHLLRTHIGTDVLAIHGGRRGGPALSPRQSWTPFAVDT